MLQIILSAVVITFFILFLIIKASYTKESIVLKSLSIFVVATIIIASFALYASLFGITLVLVLIGAAAFTKIFSNVFGAELADVELVFVISSQILSVLVLGFAAFGSSIFVIL